MHKFTKQHKDSAIGSVCTFTGDYLQALIDAGIVEEVKNRLKGMPSMRQRKTAFFTRRNEKTEQERFDTGDYFDNTEASREHNKWLIARTELIRACHEISGGENGFIEGEDNWVVYYDYSDYTLSCMPYQYQQMGEQFLQLRTYEQSQRLIDEHSDALKVYLGVE